MKVDNNVLLLLNLTGHMLKVIEAYHHQQLRVVCKKLNVRRLPTPTPQFVFCQYATICKEPYKRYLENKIRDNWIFRVQLIS
jgi:GTP-binding protein